MDGNEPNNWQYQPEGQQPADQTSDTPEATPSSQNDQTPKSETESIEWTASEYIAHQKSAGWYLALGLGGLVLVGVVYLITTDIFATVVIALVCIVIGIFAARQPNTIRYVINTKGVKVGDKFYPFSTFKSFSILEEGAIECVWLRPLKRFMPTVAMYFSPNDEGKIVDSLSNVLPLEKREHDVIERISRRFRF